MATALSGPPRRNEERQTRAATKSAGMVDTERNQRMNQLIGRWQQYGEGENTKKQGKVWDKILGTGTGYENFDADALRSSLFDTENPYDSSQYAWGPAESDVTPNVANDVNLDSSLNDLANPPGPFDVSTAVPSWLDLGGNANWKDIAQAQQQADWIEYQQHLAGMDRAANVQGQQLESMRALADQPVMDEQYIQQLLGGYAGNLADTEGRTMNALTENLGTRGIGAGSGVGAAIGAQASMGRQQGMAGQENMLRTQAQLTNRQGLERALGLQSGAASNLSNVLTGFGTQQSQLPAADYWRTLQHPNWLTPDAGGQAMGNIGIGLQAAGSGMSAFGGGGGGGMQMPMMGGGG